MEAPLGDFILEKRTPRRGTRPQTLGHLKPKWRPPAKATVGLECGLSFTYFILQSSTLCLSFSPFSTSQYGLREACLRDKCSAELLSSTTLLEVVLGFVCASQACACKQRPWLLPHLISLYSGSQSVLAPSHRRCLQKTCGCQRPKRHRSSEREAGAGGGSAGWRERGTLRSDTRKHLHISTICVRCIRWNPQDPQFRSAVRLRKAQATAGKAEEWIGPPPVAPDSQA